MKIFYNNMIMWWRVAVAAVGIALAIMAVFSFFLYKRVNTIPRKPVSLPAENRTIIFSPTLLDDMNAFWEKRQSK